MKRKIRSLSDRWYLVKAIILLSTLSTWAQNHITGVVTDVSDGSPLIGVSVVEKGSSNGTLTDADGTYSIDASSPNAVLVYSYTGFQPQEITVGSQTKIDVVLDLSDNILSEVVVVGYGTRKKSDLTGSISQISAKDYKDQPIVRMENALQGRASGVTVTRASGSPGSPIKVRVRGINSITGTNDPLVVIDGIIGGDLTSLNPNDIETMDVLKDASATAIYGSRGSNGVIIVTTKKGTSKPSVSLEYFTTSSKIPKFIETLNAADFADLENFRRISSGGDAIFSDDQIQELKRTGGYDYQRAIFKTGVSQNILLSTSGKSGKISYFMSGGYTDQGGIMIGTNYKRLSGRLNLSSQITDKLTIGMNLFAIDENRMNNEGRQVLVALTYDPTTPIKDENGQYINYSNLGLAHLGYNPVAELSTRSVKNITDRVNANLNISYDLLEGLNYTMVGGVKTTNGTSERYYTTPPFPSANFNSDLNQGLQVSNILSYQKTMGKHDLKLTGLYEFQQNVYRGNGYSANNITVPAGFYVAELNKASAITNDYNKTGIESLMARAEYIFDENLFITGTVRRDRSSRFRSGYDTGIFPSIAVAYSLSDLGFVQNSNVISALKLRGGWGQVGNQNISAYSTFPSININSKYLFDGGTISPGSTPSGYGNPELTWETTSQGNVGIDFGLLNQRFTLSVDAYQKRTTDLLLLVPVPDFAGGGSVPRNVGEVKNVGIDLTLGGAIINNNKFRWDANFTGSKLKNTVVSLGGPSEIQGNYNAPDGSGRPLNIIQVGKPLAQFYGETFLGTWKTAEADVAAQYGLKPGDAKYLRNADGDIVVSNIGNGTPTFSWGFNNTFSYKNFDANIFFTGLGGYQIMNSLKGLLVGSTGEQRSWLAPEQLNHWTPDNETDIPIGGQNRVASSRYLEKGDFARLSNLSLSYNITSIPKIQSAKLYISGQNLLLITKFSGYDPESNSGSGGTADTAAGVNSGAYPNPRSITFGAKISL
ncbi:TonB-dependent receptor [Marinilongibacter aquaticus]|uniref:SusC/RagA family TonB-linked outer membrane protein n=1 Tax=Marinilongibacter aquaticus TaxID=2975157 RepID=UPI0021BD44A3|nr:TonB-dependent receptor [Marinilongibacter aquaticus]UBM59347.1 TonB-dependent receptor [Marinilongibacter aquaticus]